MPAFAEHEGQAFSLPCSSENTRAKRSETCDPQWSQLGMICSGNHRAGVYAYASQT
jgi:hypothetical protein